MQNDYDLLVIGAGHNALISAAYAAKAGYRVGVFERRNIAGGAVSTTEIIPGYRFDLGGSAHILIRLTPIVEELNLSSYGLRYIELDPLFFAPFPDGDHLFIYRDLDKTVAHLNDRFPGEGDRYRRFINDWKPFAAAVKDAFLSTPSPLEIGRKMIFRKTAPDWKSALKMILKPYGEVVDAYFTSEKLKAALVWMAAQSGPPPTEPLSAPFLLWHPLYHEGGIARPEGGSGMLTQALVRMIEAHGGTVHLGDAVQHIDVDARGRATGLRTAAGVHTTARGIVAGTHVLESLGKLLPEAYRPKGIQDLRTGNGFGAIVRLALNKPISYSAAPGAQARTALQLICADRHQLNAAYADYLCGRPAQRPPIVGMSFSAVDPTLAPEGHEVLWLWAQYYPYALRKGNWDEIAAQEEERIIDTFETFAPGTKESIVGSLFQHPLWLERELGLFKGNVMHLEMSLDQMFMLRPNADLARYKTPIKGLYLTGASTHPGGGIMGASGRNAARVVLKDLDRRRI